VTLVVAATVAVWPEGRGGRDAGSASGAGAGQLRPGSSASTSAAATRATASTAAPPPRELTLVAAGDVLLHPPLWAQAEADAAATGRAGRDFRPLMAGVRRLVSDADLAVCHLETPVAAAGEPPAGYPAFSVPPEIVPALADTGFDVCSTASNHTYDRGAAGVDRTLAALDAAGIAHAGSARTAEEAARVTLLRAGGAEVALLSYTFGFNGVPAPRGETWRSNPIEPARILADAATARRAGAEVVVVALHWGAEYRSEPTADQRALGPTLARSPDVDLVLGHHAHVVQPLEHVAGEWVVYGMGNFVAHHGTANPANQEGLLVRFTFRETQEGWRVGAAEYAALHVTRGSPLRLVDVGALLAAPDAGPVRVDPTRLQEAWARTTAAAGALGAHDHGLAPIAGGARAGPP
jgi:Bacterial capsule synthesis protein PGA_cap